MRIPLDWPVSHDCDMNPAEEAVTAIIAIERGRPDLLPGQETDPVGTFARFTAPHDSGDGRRRPGKRPKSRADETDGPGV